METQLFEAVFNLYEPSHDYTCLTIYAIRDTKKHYIIV